MFHQDHGGKFASGNKRFEVGGEVFANLNSNYTGLFGYVTEIRRKDGQDTPENCCSFTPQKTLDGPYTRERYVSKQWSHLKKLDEPELEGVVMTPEMLEAIPHSRKGPGPSMPSPIFRTAMMDVVTERCLYRRMWACYCALCWMI